jgi:hypothetical protein
MGMKLIVIIPLFAIIKVYCSMVRTDCPLLVEQFTELEAEPDASQSSIIKGITLFPAVEKLCGLSRVKFNSIFYIYYAIIKRLFLESPIEFLQAARRYGNFEFAYYLAFILEIKMDEKKDSFIYEIPFMNIRKMETHSIENLRNYPFFVLKILNMPFKALSQNRDENKNNGIEPLYGAVGFVPLNNDIDSKTFYNPIADWEKRKEIMQEFILLFKSFFNSADQMNLQVKFLIRKITMSEFLIKKFQVDSQGPSYDHFLSTFYWLKSLIQNCKSYTKISVLIKRLLSLYKLYCKHLTEHQLTDPSLFPTSMLAIISHKNLAKEKIFSLLKCPPDALRLKAIDSLRKFQLLKIYKRESENPISKGFGCKKGQIVKNVESKRKPVYYVSLDKGFWLNLLSLKNTFTPQEEWFIRVYLILLK